MHSRENEGYTCHGAHGAPGSPFLPSPTHFVSPIIHAAASGCVQYDAAACSHMCQTVATLQHMVARNAPA